MKNIMARTPHESSFSFSRRHFERIIGKMSGPNHIDNKQGEREEDEESTLNFIATSSSTNEEVAAPAARKKQRHPSAAGAAASRLRTAFTAAIAGRPRSPGLGHRVTGTLFGHRRGHVHFAFQTDPRSAPAVLLELATPTSTLVREMASGLVRIALECDRNEQEGKPKRLLEEPIWRAYCNGKKCGYAVRRECGPGDSKVLRAVEPVSMGAGVLPGDGAGVNGEMMYMRARFERVVGSKDSVAFYMMSPDGNGGPELSIYLLRV